MEIIVKTSRYSLPVENFTKKFAGCWNAAASHIQRLAKQGDYCDPPPKGKFRWHKAVLHPPFLEHLSFSLGNLPYFIQVSDVEGRLQIPGSKDGLLRIADGWDGYPCFMPMRIEHGAWRPSRPGWGLIHAKTGKDVDPPALITELSIELTTWELHDFAISIVRDNLRQHGLRIISWSNDPEIDPSLWFIGDDGPEWVVIRAAMHPQTITEPPDNMTEIALGCSEMASRGHFACVTFNNIDDKSKPLYREHAANFEYDGLVEFTGTTRRKGHGIHFYAMQDGTYTTREAVTTTGNSSMPLVMMGTIIGDISGSSYEGKYIKELPNILITERDRFTDTRC